MEYVIGVPSLRTGGGREMLDEGVDREFVESPFPIWCIALDMLHGSSYRVVEGE